MCAMRVVFDMPRKATEEEGPDSFQAGVFAACQDVSYGNRMFDKFQLADLPNNPYWRGYKRALPLAKDRRREAMGLKKFFGSSGGFNAMANFAK